MAARWSSSNVQQAVTGGGAEVERVANAARSLLARGRLAIVVTPAPSDGRLESLELGSKVAASLSDVVRHLSHARAADLWIFKGGVTSAVCARDGLGMKSANVRGPVESGVALWESDDSKRCLVVPGNVGDDEILSRLVSRSLRQ